MAIDSKAESGFHLYFVGLLTVVAVVVGLVGWRIASQDRSDIASDSNQGVVEGASTTAVTWTFREGRWRPSKTPPACIKPFKIRSPVDVNDATSVLYPGQERGGNYKPHGGFRFDNNTDNNQTIRAPMAAKLFRGSRYYENGVRQYMFDFIHPCGIMYRLDHLKTLSAKMKTYASRLPAPLEGDTRTTQFSPMPSIDSNQLIATGIGSTDNYGFDWGVYDLRKRNAASADESYRTERVSTRQLSYYALCWLQKLKPLADKELVLALPPTGGNASSDYCN